MIYHWFPCRPRVSERKVKKVWSPGILQFHMKKNKSWKFLISLLSLLFLILSSQTHSPVLLFTFFSLLKAEEKIKSHLWISEIYQGFALFYQEFRHMLGWIKIQPLFSMASGNEIPGYDTFTVMCTHEKVHVPLENYRANPQSSTEEIYAPKSLLARKTTATCGCSLHASLYFSSERCTTT